MRSSLALLSNTGETMIEIYCKRQTDKPTDRRGKRQRKGTLGQHKFLHKPTDSRPIIFSKCLTILIIEELENGLNQVLKSILSPIKLHQCRGAEGTVFSNEWNLHACRLT